jgi:hypothetical protein
MAFSNTGGRPGDPEVVVVDSPLDLFVPTGTVPGPCVQGETIDVALDGLPAAVAYDSDDVLYVQTAAPYGLFVADDGTPVVTAPADASSGSQALFHQVTGSGVACASCHPEGLEDATVWTFLVPSGGMLQRRTMALAGSILARQPYHWTADLADPDALMHDTFTTRMGGEAVPHDTTEELFSWLDGLRPVRSLPLVTDGVVELGRKAFERAGCDQCHSGPAFANNQVEVVRPAKAPVKTPSLLGVGTRSFLLHDGCAASIEERFEPRCDDEDTDTHGTLSELSSLDLDALTAYLRTL